MSVDFFEIFASVVVPGAIGLVLILQGLGVSRRIPVPRIDARVKSMPE